MRGDSVAAEAWTHSPCAWPRRTGRDRLRDLIDRVAQGRLRRIVTRVLAIRPRGFVPNDVLHLSKLSAQLQIEWRSRDVHPWDRSVASDRRARLFRGRRFLTRFRRAERSGRALGPGRLTAFS